ncbi:integrase [Sphingomonas oleivorans]|uniref:Integrase n=1 Tax=Sphingomonas oleivorans TaxID=1735121 RepID=A0A2T5G1A2_9SPHN|nr:integrase arm-type DNA-binding domain-containing protein [Sphingomonas oleivorans]PTQ12919.1 integrase [Sphingomonas oleivorans]
MALTDAQARKARPAEKDYKLSDSLGLFLFVTTTGYKSWRFKYRFAKKEKLLTFGAYPEISLSEARDLRDAARKLLREHKDPAIVRKQEKAAAISSADQTFEKIAREWHEEQKARWSAAHAETVIESLERDIFDAWGGLPIAEINIPMVVDLLKGVQRRGAVETAHRLRQRISAIFVFAGASGLVTADPADKVGAVLKPMPKKTKMPALLEMEKLRQLLKEVEGPLSTANVITKLASRFVALTVPRPGVARAIGWAEFEGIDWETCETDDPLWRIPPDRMKLEKDKKDEVAFEHIIPLSTHAIDVLRVVRRLTSRASYVFPAIRYAHRPMSENTIAYAYNRVGYQGRHVPHGWRAAFSTVMNERAERAGRDKDREIIDLFLAHIPKGVSGSEGAYNRAAYMPRRRELAQEWGDLLMEGMAPARDLLGATQKG